ncbi:MAG TPA: zinc-binding dehydrogenase [Acidimicrobiales bacterium]|nr:zinc-binding dehydrogenase [Acidimicrobiales bacterium]
MAGDSEELVETLAGVADNNPSHLGDVVLWDTATGRQLRGLCAPDGSIAFNCGSIAFSPDGKTLATGSPRTFAVAAGVIAKAGTIVVVGADHGDASLPLGDIQDREVTVTGVAMYTPADVSAAEAFVADHVELVSGLVTAEFPVSQAPEAFRLAASGAAVKVQLVDGA